MATPPLLPVDDLLTPIADDNPAGDTVPFSIRQELEENRKQINPKDFAEDDPRRPTELKLADWSAIVRLAETTLRETSKDLLVAARLTEALVKQNGFAGLRDGLQLLRRLVEDCWDRLHPSIEDGDLEVRAGPFNWLDDSDHGARFPATVRRAPLVLLGGEGYGWQHWKQSHDNKGELKAEDFERAVLATPHQYCQDQVEDLEAAQAELTQLTDVLNTRLGEYAPSLLQIQQALTDCATLAQQILHRKGPAALPPEEDEDARATPAVPELTSEGAVAPAERPRRARTRADVYQQLNEAAQLLQQMEPHSPIPYLIQKAIALGAMPFPQLMRALIRDDTVIQEMNRELGIKDETTPSE